MFPEGRIFRVTRLTNLGQQSVLPLSPDRRILVGYPRYMGLIVGRIEPEDIPIWISPTYRRELLFWEVPKNIPSDISSPYPTIVVVEPEPAHRQKFEWTLSDLKGEKFTDEDADFYASRIVGGKTWYYYKDSRKALFYIKTHILAVLPGETLEIETPIKNSQWLWDGKEWITSPTPDTRHPTPDTRHPTPDL